MTLLISSILISTKFLDVRRITVLTTKELFNMKFPLRFYMAATNEGIVIPKRAHNNKAYSL